MQKVSSSERFVKVELSHKSYRPLTVLTFRLNYLLHGLNPIGFHIVNIALHAFSSILVHKLCLRFESNAKIAFTSAMVFAMHPIHTDAVASVVGRAELLSAIFYELCLLTYLNKQNGGHCSTCSSSSNLLKPLFTVSLACIGLLCKEQCLTVLIVCAAFDAITAYGKTCHTERRHRTKNITILFCGFIFALLLRVKLNGKQVTPSFNKYDNPAAVANSDTKLFTYSYLCAFNFWLLTFPFQLCCDWTHESIKLLTSTLDARNVITVAFFSTLIYVFGMPFLRKKVPEEFNKTLMFVMMTVIPFVPASNLFFTTGFVVAERVLYLPSVGFALLIAFGVKRLHSMCPNATVAAVFVLLLTFGVKTYSRCKDW
ncbi:transmembrane and TPR repeat-containing protein-like protein [Leptotrombidium deliense]|uniref:Transmembrane and TPR repeat-containing protein-like protein n=1 Tax=Leptotrombidium deliense TaxID=299467 RepID=A0A443SF04_9ACAR|nr:transmembrane and TPR repeat-containing protein-like protein [Leptotrombidium deliense]